MDHRPVLSSIILSAEYAEFFFFLFVTAIAMLLVYFTN